MNREKLYKKYNCRCAYCGDLMLIKNMQEDHILAKKRGGTDEFSNLNPSCRSCNASKATYTIEEFRTRLIEDVNRIRRDSAKFRILERFGIIKQEKWQLTFYFEENNE